MRLSSKQKSFLERTQIARMAVIDGQGYPHSVPVWYALDGEDLVVFASRSSRKISFVRANPKAAMSIGGDPYETEGYLLKGEITLEEDVDHRWLSAITHRYEPKELADEHVREWGQGDLVILRFTTQKISRV